MGEYLKWLLPCISLKERTNVCLTLVQIYNIFFYCTFELQYIDLIFVNLLELHNVPFHNSVIT